MNAPAFIEAKYGARYQAWQRNQTSARRDQMCSLIVEHMDADFRLRLIRAAARDLSGYALGYDAIDEACDLIQADLDAEDNLTTGLVPVTARGA